MQLKQIPLASIHRDPDQPRKKFADPQIQSLATSIDTLGQLHPIRVVANDDGYKIEDGERRWRAMNLLEWSACDAIVVEPGETEEVTRLKQVVANNWHQHLSITELADTVHRLVHKEFASDNEIIAHFDKLGLKITKKTIKTYHAVADLPDPIRAAIDANCVDPDEILQIAKIQYGDLPKEAFQAAMKHITERRKWGRISLWDCKSGAMHWLRDNAINLCLTEKWHDISLRVHFDQATACRGCPKKVMFGEYRFCTDRECFTDKNNAALQAAQKEKKSSESTTETDDLVKEEKQLKREDQIKRKVIAHLHRQLAKRLDEFIQDDTEEAYKLANTLCVWKSCHAPGGGSDHNNEWQRSVRAPVADIRGVLQDEYEGVGVATTMAAGREILSRLDWDNIRAITHHVLGTKLLDVWSPDEDYIKIWRKAELAAYAYGLGCHQPPGDKGWGNHKLAELVEHISSSQLDHFANHEPARYLFEEAEFNFYTTAWQWQEDDDEEDTDEEGS